MTSEKHAQANRAKAEARRMTTAQFVVRAQEVHGDKYDYSNTVYVNALAKLTIICPVHGEFEQKANAHTNGQGCPKCGKLAAAAKLSELNAWTTPQYLAKVKSVHGDRYDYSKVVYVGSLSKVPIICPEHGEFEQVASEHLRGNDCPKCAVDARRSNTEDFAEKARVVHDNKYDYSKAAYTYSKRKVTIVCPEHGDFEQKPNDHLRGKGCPACAKSVSQPELDIKALIESYGYEVQHRYRPTFLERKELDLYVPALKLAIEYCGSHVHNVDRNFLGGEPKSKTYHYDKWKACRDNGVALLTIFDFQWLTKREKVEALLRHKLQQNNRRVYARKCSIVELDRATCWEFVKANHIEGTGVWKLSCTYKGLKLGDELLAVMIEQDGDIKRSCTLQGTAVIGGVSRLFKAFPSGTTMTTTNDTGSTGDYGKRLDKSTLRYWWVNTKTREALTRNACMKHKLEARFGAPIGDMTEREYMLNLGWVRVFDSGLSYFVNT